LSLEQIFVATGAFRKGYHLFHGEEKCLQATFIER